jgi:hypothetical protein
MLQGCRDVSGPGTRDEQTRPSQTCELEEEEHRQYGKMNKTQNTDSELYAK